MKKWLKTAFCFVAICVAFFGFAGCDLFKSEKPVDPKSMLYGDVNLDGAVDYKDLTVIREYIASYTGSSGNIAEKPALSKIAKANFDVNKDNELNIADLTRLTDYLTGKIYELMLGSLGDVEMDGDIDSDDAIYITQFLANEPGYTLTAQQKINADINFDGKITQIDAEKILFHSLFGDYIPSVTVIPGDINLDEKVSFADAELLEAYLNNDELDDENKVIFNYRQYQNAKITADNEVNEQDLTRLSDYLSGKIYELVPGSLGDVEMDGDIDSDDAIYIAQYLANEPGYTLTTQQKINADINFDGEITKIDADKILFHSLFGNYIPSVTVVPGDIDLDGEVTSADATLLQSYLNNNDLSDENKVIFNYRQYQNAKITADDNVTVDDYNALLELINDIVA